MEITAALVKELRERTGAGMMDCKKALQECGGDMDKAIDFLREKGLAAAAKKAGRIAAEGIVDSFIGTDGKVGVLLEINCETDFVAKTDNFKELVHDVAAHIAEKSPADVDALLAQSYAKDSSKIVSDLIGEATVAIGEKLSIRRFVRYELKGEGIEDAYIHMGGRIGVLVEIGCDSTSVARGEAFKGLVHDIAMHIAAANPQYLERVEVPTEALDKEKEVLRAQALNEGKPEKIVEKMVEGRIEKYYKEVCLTEQPYVKDPDKSIRELVEEASKANGAKITINRFTRFERGEGLEKRVDNFAEEVMAQTGGQL